MSSSIMSVKGCTNMAGCTDILNYGNIERLEPKDDKVLFSARHNDSNYI